MKLSISLCEKNLGSRRFDGADFSWTPWNPFRMVDSKGSRINMWTRAVYLSCKRLCTELQSDTPGMTVGELKKILLEGFYVKMIKLIVPRMHRVRAFEWDCTFGPQQNQCHWWSRFETPYNLLGDLLHAYHHFSSLIMASMFWSFTTTVKSKIPSGLERIYRPPLLSSNHHHHPRKGVLFYAWPTLHSERT